MASLTTSKEGKRKISDAAKQKPPEKKNYFRNVVKGIGELLEFEESGVPQDASNANNNVLDLVQVLMGEIQRLKDVVKEQKEKQKLFIEYVSVVQEIQQSKFEQLSEQINKKEDEKDSLVQKVSSILSNCEKKKVYNQTTGKTLQASFTADQIDELVNAMNGKQSNDSNIDLSKDIPSFEDWSNAHISKKKETEKEEQEVVEEKEKETENVEIGTEQQTNDNNQTTVDPQTETIMPISNDVNLDNPQLNLDDCPLETYEVSYKYLYKEFY